MSDTPEVTQEMRELVAAKLARWRDESFADLIAAAVMLAAETHPESIRLAIGMCFDIKGWESLARSTEAEVARAANEAEQCKWLLRTLEQREEKLQRWIEQRDGEIRSLHKQIQKMHNRLDAAGKKVQWLLRQVDALKPPVNGKPTEKSDGTTPGKAAKT